MKKIGELMKDMGFNPNASQSTKEAFLKHLIKSATGNSFHTPSEKKTIAENPSKIIQFPEQLQFDFEEINKHSDVKLPKLYKR